MSLDKAQYLLKFFKLSEMICIWVVVGVKIVKFWACLPSVKLRRELHCQDQMMLKATKW